MIKNISVFIVVIQTIMLASCDIISADERLIKAENLPFERVVLLEDFTGQKCINCPNAVDEIHNLEKIYGKNLVAVSIHAGVFALPAMATKAGEEYNAEFGIESYPKGMVNRKKQNETLALDYQQWGQAIRNAIWQSSGITLNPKTSYNSSDSILNIGIEIEKLPSFADRSISLQLYLTENQITALQYMPDGSRNREYQHNHVLRDALNGSWGETVHFTANKAVANLTTYSFKGKKWIPKNCEIIAFVYDTATYEVLETVKTQSITQCSVAN